MDYKVKGHENMVLKKKACIKQPLDYEVKGHENMVLKLNKALYGLKQAPRAWYSCIDGYFIKEWSCKMPSWIFYLCKDKSDWWYSYCMLICGWFDLYRK